MKIRLLPLKKCINKKLYEMYQDIPKKEIGSSNEIYDKTYDEFLNICDNYIREEMIISEKLNTTTKRYILLIDNRPVGEVGIRTTLNDYWINKGSQIFYKIRLSERNKGYGNIILREALREAKKLSFNKIRINCNDNNKFSKKIIKSNGGVIDIVSYKSADGNSSSYIIYL